MTAPKTWLPDKGRESGPQRQFLHDLKDVYEVLNAGSVGAGKTDVGVMGAVYYKEYRNSASFCGLILRHDEKDLNKHILGLVERPGYYPRYAGGSGLNSTSLTYKMRHGGQVIFAHAKRLSGLHGPEFQYVHWDELTHWVGHGWGQLEPPPEYLFVSFTRVRSASGLRCRVRSGTNAIGPGKAWVKWRWGPWLIPSEKILKIPAAAPPRYRAVVESLQRLIDAGHIAPPVAGQPLVPSGAVLWFHPGADGVETYEAPPVDEADALKREILSRSCLRSRTEDNTALTENDPQYVLRTRAAGVVLHAQLGKDDWEMEDPDEGFFHRAWFRVVPASAVPPLAGEISRWDFAWSRHLRGSKAAERSPWSVRIRLGWTAKHPRFGRRWYIKHIVREQGAPREIMQLVQQTAKADGRHVPVLAPVDFSAGKVVLSDVRDLLEGYVVIEQRETGEKHVRIAALQGPAEGEQIFLVEGEWNHAFLDEAARYPKRPNDQLDALAGAFLHVIDTEAGIPSDEQVQEDMESAADVSRRLSGGWSAPETIW